MVKQLHCHLEVQTVQVCGWMGKGVVHPHLLPPPADIPQQHQYHISTQLLWIKVPVPRQGVLTDPSDQTHA